MSRAEKKLAELKAKEELKRLKDEKQQVVNTKELEDQKNTPDGVKKAVKVIAVVIIVFIFLGIFSNMNNSNSGPKAEQSQNTKSTESGDVVLISESDAEKFCQDDSLTPILSGNSEYNDIKMIDILNYNKNYMEYGKDKDNKPVMLLTWNGKGGDKAINFSCYVSGTKDSLTLLYLSMDGKTMRGDPDLKGAH